MFIITREGHVPVSMKEQIYKWMDEEESKIWGSKALDRILKILFEHDGNEVIAKGLDNYKTPEAYFFMAKPINIEIIQELIDKNDDLYLEVNERAGTQAVWSKKQYTALFYEPGK